MVLASFDRERARQYNIAAFVKDAASKEEIERLFKADSLTDSHVGSGGVQAAIDWLRKTERSPQRLLVDISGSARPLDELDQLADACEPSVQVFVVGERNDVGLYRNLLARGVSDYIVKPLSIDLLRRTFFADERQLRRGRHGKCVAVLGTRGGVGVTSTAAHLARLLTSGATRRRVVYVDLNTYDGSGASLLGHPGGMAFVDLIANTDRLDQQFIERALTDAGDGLYILNAELEYPDQLNYYDGSLTALLHALGQYFHYVIVDMPEKTGRLADECLEQADIVCVLSDNTVHSARVLTRLLRLVEARSTPPVIIPILNHPRPAGKNQVLDKDFEAATQANMQLNIPYDAKGPDLAENLGQPLPKNCSFYHGVRQLADIVTGEGSRRQAGRWWQRLLQRQS